MRELLFKNMTSLKRRRKTFSVQETKQQKGLLTRINKRYIYIIKSVEEAKQIVSTPQFYVFKEHDSKKQNEKLLFKVKGNFHIVNNQQAFLVYFCHSLRVALSNKPIKPSHQEQ